MKRVLAALFVLGLGCGEGAVPAVPDPLSPVTLTAQQRLEAAPATFRVITTTGSEGVFATRRVQYGPEHAPVHFSFSDGWLEAQATNGTLELTRFDATLPSIELKLGATPVELSRAQVTLPEPATLQCVLAGRTSPLEYHMYRVRIDVPLLAQASGVWQWRIRRHFRPDLFARLSPALLATYADAMGMTVEQLKKAD